jgi:probable rRNA maturation factor
VSAALAPMGEGDQPVLRILLDDRRDADPLDLGELESLARATLIGEGANDVELSVSLVTEAEIADLHERYMGEAGPTDVLSFPLDADDRDEDGVRILGDVVISPDVAARNRPENPTAEVRLLLVHGILHLLGHDHDDDDARAEMWAVQERYAGVTAP